MQRKQFLQSILPAAALVQSGQLPTINDTIIKLPAYLRKGDTIGITCPAGNLTLEELVPAQAKLEEWGFSIKLGKTVGSRFGTFAATDAERQADLQAMLNDNSIKAILCGRGGYGCNRIIDGLNFTKFKTKPKWLIGFSDITLLHTHINSQFAIASLHSKMCNSFLSDWSQAEPKQLESIDSIRDALLGKKMQYTAEVNTSNKLGSTTGKLVGGNLSIIYSAMNTASQLNAKGGILFLEEVDEKLYSIDRMLWNLYRSGMLASLKGLIIGGFKYKPSDKPDNEFNETVQDIVLNLTKSYKYPICFDFPVGHQKANYALKCGVTHRLTVTTNTVTLKEI